MTRSTAGAALLLLVLVGFVVVVCGHAASTVGEETAPPSVKPPHWLLERMTNLVRSAGDTDAAAWWALTTMRASAILSGDEAPANPAQPEEPVYVFVVHGDFTNWLWSLPYGASPPQYSWVYEVIDADSHVADSGGTRNKPVDTSGLNMHPVRLTGE